VAVVAQVPAHRQRRPATARPEPAAGGVRPPEEDAVYLGVGANLGDARAQVLQAVQDCAALERCRLVTSSSLYRSAPIDAGGDDYVNAVLQIATTLPPLDLLDALQAIERRHGRERPYRNAPRTLDLDLLLYGRQCIAHPRLTVPHPRLHQRAFVLVPLAEIAPGLVLPGLGPIADHLVAVADQDIERITP
jgi:2-amino-4-hydroxy-6-hydroxymethyldihydropteridine diphosphokinase